MSPARIVILAVAASLAVALGASGVGQSAPPQPVGEGTAPPLLPSIGALKSEYIRCERISSQRRLSMHGMAFCSAVSDQLLKREFGGDLDLLLAWWRGEQQASMTRIDR